MIAAIGVGIGNLFNVFWPGFGFSYRKGVEVGFFYHAGKGNYDMGLVFLGFPFSTTFKGLTLELSPGLSISRFRMINISRFSTGVDYSFRVYYKSVFAGIRGFYDGGGNLLWIEVGTKAF